MKIPVIAATSEVIKTLQKAKATLSNINLIPNQKESKQQQDQQINPQGILQGKIISGNNLSGYICGIYENGFENDPTYSVLAFLNNGASSLYSIPSGTIVYLQASTTTFLGNF